MNDAGQVFADLVRVETRLYNTLNDRLRARHGLTAGQFEFLGLIARDEGCRVNDLAREFAVTTGAASKGVDRLEAAGWVERTPHPGNRRSSVLRLTERGRDLVEAATPTFDSVLDERLLAPLTPDALAALGAAVHLLRTALEDAGVGAPSG